MKKIVLYYTFGGSSRKEAERIASQDLESVLCEVLEQKKRSMLSAFFSGCPQALKRKASLIKELPFSLTEFDRIILVAPVWAGYPVPAFNAMVDRLPQGKEVEIYLCSAGGETPKSEAGTKELIEQKKCKLISFHQIKTSKQ